MTKHISITENSTSVDVLADVDFVVNTDHDTTLSGIGLGYAVFEAALKDCNTKILPIGKYNVRLLVVVTPQ